LATDCQRELDKVTPILEGAAALLDKIEKKDIDTLKSFPKPPASAAIVMEGLCYAFNKDQ
jgi:dynein heavy chain